jgi:hypothetical protein
MAVAGKWDEALRGNNLIVCKREFDLTPINAHVNDSGYINRLYR